MPAIIMSRFKITAKRQNNWLRYLIIVSLLMSQDVDSDSWNPRNEHAGIPALDVPGIVVFTDGSMKNQSTGAGVVFYTAGAPVQVAGKKLIHSYKLRDKNSVFQTEVWAIKQACKILLENITNDPPLGQVWVRAGWEVTFYSDSQAALKALETVIVKTQLVRETISALNQLAQLCSSVTLRWVRGHQKHDGNEDADTAALEGRVAQVTPEEDAPELPLAARNMDVDLAATSMWKTIWRLEKGCRQTRYWFPDGPRPDFAFDLLRLPRVICSQLCQFITGHCFLNKHTALIENNYWGRVNVALAQQGIEEEDVIEETSSQCRLCGTGKEEPFHLMSECWKLNTLRLRTFGHHKPLPPYTNIKVYQLVAFLKVINLPSLEMKPYLEQYAPTSIPEEARPTPQPPIVEGAENISSESEDELTAQQAAEAAGGRLLHNYLLTSNNPPLPNPEDGGFY